MIDTLFDSLASLQRRHRNTAILLAVLGMALFLPMIGSFGLWEPSEVRVADIAKEVATSSGWAIPLKAGQVRPPLNTWIVVAGFRAFGVTDIGGRLPVALTAILALLACYYAGTALLRRRAALLGALALATMPVFFLGARQLTTAVGTTLAAALAIGGLARAAWPRDDEDGSPTSDGMRLLHGGVGVLGLVLGYFAAGLVLGVAVPLIAVAAALVASGAPAMATLIAGGAALAVVGVSLSYWLGGLAKPIYSAILGGTPRASASSVQLTTVLKQIGFGAFPWVALLPLGAARALAGDEAGSTPGALSPTQRRERFGRIAVLAWVLTAYLLATLFCASFADTAFPGMAAVALIAGLYVDAALDDKQRMPYAGLVAFIGAVVLAHDFFLQPESFVGAHVLEGIKWPPLNAPPYFILLFGVFWSLVVGVGLGVRGDGRFRKELMAIAVGGALMTAFVTVYWITPSVSKHLSAKGIFTRYPNLGAEGELAQYHVPSQAAAYYLKGKPAELSSLQQVFDFLAKPQRTFVMVSAEDIAPIDQFAKSRPSGPVIYYVVDDSNSRIPLLSNKLGPGEQDRNALRRLIVDKLPRPPQHEVKIDFEGKVELVGYDLPAELERGRSFVVTLYYKVNAPVAGGYKTFLHFDGPGSRFNGDHVPLEGKFPTNYWVPGFYIIDEHRMEPDRATSPSGWYQIYTGFWIGEGRLKVTSGPSDGENRAKIGTVRVK